MQNTKNSKTVEKTVFLRTSAIGTFRKKPGGHLLGTECTAGHGVTVSRRPAAGVVYLG